MDYWHSHELLEEYYATRWGFPCHDDHELCRMVILESFSCGLSWLLILKKEKNFDEAFDHFDLERIANYNEEKIEELCQNDGIVKNRSKIKCTIKNAQIMLEIIQEYGSFDTYIWSFTQGKTIQILEPITTNDLSDTISTDLRKKGMRYFGSVTVFSYLQAIGIINSRLE